MLQLTKLFLYLGPTPPCAPVYRRGRRGGGPGYLSGGVPAPDHDEDGPFDLEIHGLWCQFLEEAILRARRHDLLQVCFDVSGAAPPNEYWGFFERYGALPSNLKPAHPSRIELYRNLRTRLASQWSVSGYTINALLEAYRFGQLFDNMGAESLGLLLSQKFAEAELRRRKGGEDDQMDNVGEVDFEHDLSLLQSRQETIYSDIFKGQLVLERELREIGASEVGSGGKSSSSYGTENWRGKKGRWGFL